MVKRQDTTHPVAKVFGEELPPPDVIGNLQHIDVWDINYYAKLSFTSLCDRWAVRSPTANVHLRVRRRIRLAHHGEQALAKVVCAWAASSSGSLTSIGRMAEEMSTSTMSAAVHPAMGLILTEQPTRSGGLVELDRVPREAYHAYAKVQLPSATAFTATANGATTLHCTAGGCTRHDASSTFAAESANSTAWA